MTFTKTCTKTFGLVVAAAALVLASIPVGAAPAAKMSFDGSWSVVIVTQKGDCDRAYRYPVTIKNGSLQNAGDVPVEVLGKVKDDGAVTVTVSYGQKSANGSGRMSLTDGSGSWSGGGCAGVWTAERRS